VRGGPTDDVAPSWSNDGTRLAFLRLQGNVGEILVMPATGGDARVVADASEGASFARICWTPDDRFVVAAARGKERSFVIAPTDGTGSPTQIESTGSLSADTCTVQRLAE
jgi:Tol biopolymer transport system component